MFVFLSGTIENYWNVWRVAGKTALGLTFARRFIRSSIEYWSRSATNSMMSFRSAASAKGSLSQLNFSTFHNHVLDPASLQVNRRARRPKTDRIDADRMVRALIRHLRGEPEACSVIRVPSPEQEDVRRLHRERDR